MRARSFPLPPLVPKWRRPLDALSFFRSSHSRLRWSEVDVIGATPAGVASDSTPIVRGSVTII